MDIEIRLQQAMSNAGVSCPDLPVADGEIRRFYVEGDRSGTKNGWCVLYGDGVPAGAFGNWKTDLHQNWCARNFSTMTEVERTEHQRRMEEAKEKRKRAQKEAHDKAKQRANEIWRSAHPAHADHPYLVSKNVGADGIRERNGRLLIPLRDSEGTIHSLQFIGHDGQKRFLTDGAIRGHYHGIGKLTDPLYIVEGYATGATVHEATGGGVVIAFNCGNLLSVAKAIRHKYPDQQLVIAADNDLSTEGNPGVTAAKETAKAVGGCVAIPMFVD